MLSSSTLPLAKKDATSKSEVRHAARLVMCNLLTRDQPIGQTGQSVYAGIDYGHVFGRNTAFLASAQFAAVVIGVRGSASTRFGALGTTFLPAHRSTSHPAFRLRA